MNWKEEENEKGIEENRKIKCEKKKKEEEEEEQEEEEE
jgi:hypothetical protein